MTEIIDGRELAKKHEEALREKISRLKLSKQPILVSFLIGEDPASAQYTGMKQKKAQSLGIDFQVEKHLATVSFEEMAKRMDELNRNPDVVGIMVQLPSLPGLKDLINPKKDVDGLLLDSPFTPAVVRAVVSILDDEKVKLDGTPVTVVGYSPLIGQPLVEILRGRGAIVTPCNRKTLDLKAEVLKADVVISTVGKANLVTGDMVKEGVVVVDVGTVKLDDGRVVGDVDFPQVSLKAAKITPVPGGVGPMTVISLMENMYDAVVKN